MYESKVSVTYIEKERAQFSLMRSGPPLACLLAYLFVLSLILIFSLTMSQDAQIRNHYHQYGYGGWCCSIAFITWSQGSA